MKQIKTITMLILLFSAGVLVAQEQEFDKSLYQRITSLRETMERRPDGRGSRPIRGHYKIDLVFVDSGHWYDKPENSSYTFFELRDSNAEGSWLTGLTGRWLIAPGQLVTVYFLVRPEEEFDFIFSIDHIEIPAVDFIFTPTHRTTREVNLRMSPVRSSHILSVIKEGTKVQLIGTDYPFSQLVSITTANAFAGWVFDDFLEPITESVYVPIAETPVAEAPAKTFEEARPTEQPAHVMLEQAHGSNNNTVLFVILGFVGLLLVGSVLLVVKRKKS